MPLFSGRGEEHAELAQASQAVSDLITEIGRTLPPQAHMGVISLANTVADVLGMPTDEGTRALVDDALVAAGESVEAYAEVVRNTYVGQGYSGLAVHGQMRSLQVKEYSVPDPKKLSMGEYPIADPAELSTILRALRTSQARALLNSAAEKADLPDDIRAALSAPPNEGEPQPVLDEGAFTVEQAATILHYALGKPADDPDNDPATKDSIAEHQEAEQRLLEERKDFVVRYLEGVQTAAEAGIYAVAAERVDAYLRYNAAVYSRAAILDGLTPLPDSGEIPLAAFLPKIVANTGKAIEALDALGPALERLQPLVSDEPRTEEELAKVDKDGAGDEWRRSPAENTAESVAAVRRSAAAARRLNTALSGVQQRWKGPSSTGDAQRGGGVNK